MPSSTLNYCLNALDVISIHVVRRCTWLAFKLTCLVDLLYLLCVRGRSAGEVLCGQGHAGSWWHHDQADAPQTGAAERSQLAAGRWDTTVSIPVQDAWLACVCCRNFFKRYRLCNLVPATPQMWVAGPGPASKSPELASCGTDAVSWPESVFIYVSLLPVCGQTACWIWKLGSKLLFIYFFWVKRPFPS